MLGESKAHEVIREFARISGDRGNWEGHWQEIAERVLPAHSPLFRDLGKNSTRGDKRMEHVFDSTASIALKRFGSILDSLLTPRNQTWHRLMPSDPYLARDRQVTLWFEEVNRLLFKYRYAAIANFASQNQQNYLSLGAYGTGCMFIDELRTGSPGIRYRNVHLGEVFFSENHQGIVDKAYRRFNMTARQLVQRWGDKVSDAVKKSIEKQPEREFEVIHAVAPREDLDPTRKDFRGMPIASLYVLKDGCTLLEESGYTSFPYAISRYEQAPGEIYGRSPAMDVLPAIKTLNEEKKTILKQGHRAVDPVLLAHDDGVVDSFSLRPGAINAGGVNADGRALVQALPVGNIHIGKELMDDERAIINDAFLVTIFQILVDTPQMTATEVLERTREKGILLAPTIGRQQTEYLGPMIERETDILSRLGVLPPMPELLREAAGDYRIEYDSPISRSQRAEEASGIMRTIETALQVVNVTQNSEPLDHFNWDTIIPEMSEIQGVPARWMRSAEDIAQIRQGRAQQQEAQQMIQAAPAAAAMMKAGTQG